MDERINAKPGKRSSKRDPNPDRFRCPKDRQEVQGKTSNVKGSRICTRDFRRKDSKSPETKQSRGISLSGNQQVAELRQQVIDLDREVELLRNENITLRQQTDKVQSLREFSDGKFQHRMENLFRKEKKSYEMMLHEYEQRIRELEVMQSRTLKEKDELQLRIQSFESDLQEAREIQQDEAKINKDIKEANLTLIMEKESLQMQLSEMKQQGSLTVEHESILRRRLREEYEKKLNELEKEVGSLKLRLEKNKESGKSKKHEELKIVTEHYQNVIRNLQNDMEKLQGEKETAVDSFQTYKSHILEKQAAADTRSKSKIQQLERKIRHLQKDKCETEEQKQKLKEQLSEFHERRGQEAHTLMHIEEVLKKHELDLEKQVMELEKEKQNWVTEKDMYEIRLEDLKKENENKKNQLKSTREVLENRICELYQRNEKLSGENMELKQSTELKEEEWIRTMSKAIGQEEMTKKGIEEEFKHVVEAYKKEKKEQDAELEYLRERIRALETEKQSIGEEIILAKKLEMDHFQEQINSLETEKNTLLNRIQEMESKTDVLKKADETARENLRQTYDESILKLQSDIDSLMQEKESLQSKVEELEYTLNVKSIDDQDEKDADIENYQRTIQDLQEEIIKERKKLEKKEDEWKEMKESWSKKEESVQVLYASLERTVQKYLKEKEILEKTVCEQEREITQQQRQTESLLKEKTALQNQLDEVKRKKEDKMNSKMISDIQSESRKLKDIEEKLERDVQNLLDEKQNWEREKKKLQQRISTLESQLKLNETKMNEVNQTNEFLATQKEKAFSKIMELEAEKMNNSDQEKDDSPDITLTDRFNELYTTEFAKALQVLSMDSEIFVEETDAIKCLTLILKVIYEECDKVSNEQLDEMQTVLGLTMASEDKIRHLRSCVATECMPNIIKKIKKGLLQKAYSEYLELCDTYIVKCIEMCWLMRTCNPPMLMVFDDNHGSEVDDCLYEFYSEAGSKVDFLVWPVLYRHDNGPILHKGIIRPLCE